jgi:hypothetical protein
MQKNVRWKLHTEDNKMFLLDLAFQGAQSFFFNIPLSQNVEDRPGAEASSSQLAENTRCFLLVFGLD